MTLFDVSDGGDREPRRVTLVRLAAHIAKAAADIGRIAVEGEVHRPSGSTGRLWFTLRDRASQVSVSVPAGRRARARVVAGERVCVTGRLEWVPMWGQLQLVAESVVPVGEGAIAAMIAEARARLDKDGLLSRPRKWIPRLPRRVGVICGREAAVRADIESVVAHRFPGYPVVFVETTVSGSGAPDHIIAALEDLQSRVDVIILARGGGDATQLLPFSDEDLCRSVCASAIPVVSAIGHDGDRPLVDEVADLRCGTPSIAAAAVIPDRAALHEELATWLAAARQAAAARVDIAAHALARIDRRAAAVAGLDRATARLERASAARHFVDPRRELDRAAQRLGALHNQVESLGPQRVLERGYAIVRRDGEVLRAPPEHATPIEITVAGGSFGATSE